MKLTIVDVFAERRYAGNQLAVVEGAGALDTASMHSIAREMNFAETTFVTERDDAGADVRIFTPVDELPFAGHPTLGTAWVLTGGVGNITLRLGAGPVTVAFDADGLGSFEPPPVSLNGAFPRAQAAELLSLTEEDLLPDWPVERAVVGPSFLLIPVARLAALKAVSVDSRVFAETFADEPGLSSLFAFSPEAYGPDADFAARMFFDAHGIREDSATGSANSAFAAYLTERLGRTGRVVVDQGVEIQRPSRLYLELGERLRVGGRVFESVRGTLV